MSQPPLQIVARVAEAIGALGARYLISGSLASSHFGVPRATLDADLVVEIGPADVEELARLLGNEFYADVARMREALRAGSSFNLIHLPTLFKIDVFPSPAVAWSRERMERAREERVDAGPGPVSLRFSSPEDTLLHKLVWYRSGGEVSDRQWQDVLSILRVQGEGLDQAHLDRWAPELGVADLVARARRSR